jgi:TrmH family RNA methyltransferase
MIISSFSNPKIKSIRKLEQKKYRQESGLFFVEGLRTVGEAVQLGASIRTLVVSPELLESDFGLSLLIHPNVLNVERIEVSGEIFKKIANKEGPQGIGAVVQQDWHTMEKIRIDPDDLWIALDAVADPGNLGTIMRTLDAVDGRGVILLGNSTDPYDPAAVKSSMGALFSLELVQADWPAFLKWKSDKGISLIGTSDHAEEDYQAISYRRPLILLMGSERHGLSEEMEGVCDQMARIPMAGRSDSLNLAIATAIMLYEIHNQSRNLVTIEP